MSSKGRVITHGATTIIDLSQGSLCSQQGLMRRLIQASAWHGTPNSPTSCKISENDKRVAIGLDIGTRHVGIAMSDKFGRIAFPVRAFVRSSITEDVQKIKSLVDGYGARIAVMGVPNLNTMSHGKHKNTLTTSATTTRLDGDEGESVKRFILTYGVNVLHLSGVRVIALWDESYSTAFAREGLRDMKLLNMHHNQNRNQQPTGGGQRHKHAYRSAKKGCHESHQNHHNNGKHSIDAVRYIFLLFFKESPLT